MLVVVTTIGSNLKRKVAMKGKGKRRGGSKGKDSYEKKGGCEGKNG